MPKSKREVDVLVLSDIHLGTMGCRAEELLKYLSSIQPKKVILNGDIVDIWQFSKRFWPKSHMRIIKHFTSFLSKGIPVYYVTGNHDELLRKFEGFTLGGLSIVNKIVLNLDGKKAWIFHGDVFDVTMQYAKWLTKLGSIGYDLLILINSAVNFFAKMLGKEKVSLSKKIKNSVKSAVKYINNFEEIAGDIAITKGYDYVVCGHIHHPEMKEISNKEGATMYLNSGDWIESLSALEYHQGKWSIYEYSEDENARDVVPDLESYKLDDYDKIFKEMLTEFTSNNKLIAS
ncbi:UDP-2,3-diacylglucosamine diphosphatase [Labilibaculum euxinus]|uniref:UDP-2,3-diacylglucosamine diphosphatase n=1 Tax=Labilibaculum euxinus TaxID=2686357 RepID=A0A7M4DBE6_9BACT|nr:UDP-2,3-diacylglucosamine diphosphatase [Labilibaculum euxinus]MUP39975.1 UDP-2,3-diacylglucosamine diphosphatase [Labilibaculum euxinus]MVB09180.1 UDP-2,3-diacylglucosamine diphosphatase [Labilibaculum euxinus]